MNKVKPKFHKDEWIITKANNLYKILAIIDDKYQLKYGDNYSIRKCADVDKNARPWNIWDAKPGDVLYSDLMDGNTFIYGGINQDGAILYSFIINNSGEDVLPYNIGKLNTGIGYIEENKNIIHPATNEQRDLLFQRMKEVGYEFDFKKKELKKISSPVLSSSSNIGKVEPKFHECDLVVDNCGYVWKIEGITNRFYLLEGVEGGESRPIIEWVNKTFHLWTIEDAKDGDVLAVEPIDGYQFPFIAIYKNRGLDFFNSYCLVGFDGKFYEGTTGHALDNIHPATKEQRDLLFQKMEEAGYEWDADEKELRLIEYNGEDYGIDSLYHAQRILEKTLGKVDGYQTDDGILAHKCAITLVKRLYEHKPNEWSEEDSARLQRIADFLWKNRKGDTDTIYQQEQDANWLKSLKSKCDYNPYKAVVESIAKMCDKYEAFASDEVQMRDFLCNVKAKCHEAVEYDRKYCQN